MYKLCIALLGWGMCAYVGANEKLDTIVVSGSQNPLPRAELGTAVTLITREEIETQGYSMLADMLRNVPGVAVSQSGNSGSFTQIRLRGTEADHTQVLLNGMPLNDPAQSDQFNFGYLLSDTDIERVEIIRGPQSALWGSDSIGGTINIVTRKTKGIKENEVDLRFEGGSFNTKQLSLGATMNIEKTYANMQATVLSSNGTNVAQSGSEQDGYNNRTYSFNFGYTPIDSLDLGLTARFVNANTMTDPQPAALVTDSPDYQSKTRQAYWQGIGEWDTFNQNWQHRFATSVLKTRTRNQTPTSTSYSNGTEYQYTYQSKLRLTDYLSFLPQGWSQTAALLLQYQDSEARGSFIGAQNQTIGYTTKSYAGEYQIRYGDRFSLVAGIRHDNYRLFNDATTYRLSASYLLPNDSVRFHTSYGSGIKNPTITELYGFFSNFIGNPNLRAEQSKGWDVGISQVGQWAIGKWQFDMTYFNNQVTNLITGSGNRAINQAGTNQIYGLENSFEIDLSVGLKLTGMYTYTNTEDANGLELIRRPKHTGALSLTRNFLNDRATIYLSGYYHGKQKDLVFSSFTMPPRTSLNSYLIMHLSVDYKINKNMRIYLYINNLLDKNYQEIYSYQAPKLNATLGLKVW